MKIKIPIETDRLRLRFFCEDDLDDAFEYHSDASVVRYLYWPERTKEGTREEIIRRMNLGAFEKEGDTLVLAVEEKQSQKVIGDMFLYWRSGVHQQGELGYVLNPAFQGKGFGLEASKAILKEGFSTIGFHRIFARCDARNERSYHLMERLGMRKEAHLVQNEFFKGEWSDELIFAMLAEEWMNQSY